VYLIIVLLTAGLGFIIGVISPQGLDPELFGVVQLAPTPTGTAVYGGATIGVLLGVLLLLVVFVSRRYDDAEVNR
jgi:hypothetical protein